MRAEEGVEVGAADVDFATYPGEGDEALVAVVLPRLGGYAEDFQGTIRAGRRTRVAGDIAPQAGDKEPS